MDRELCVLTWRVFVYQYGGSSARESARLNNVCKRNSITWWKWLGKRKGQQVLANNVTFLCLWEPEHNHLLWHRFLLTVSYNSISLHLAELQVLKTEHLWLFHTAKQFDTILAEMCFEETLPKIAVWTSGRKRERTSRFLSKYNLVKQIMSNGSRTWCHQYHSQLLNNQLWRGSYALIKYTWLFKTASMQRLV